MHCFGFIPNLNCTTKHNAAIRMADMTLLEYFSRPTNRAFHNLTTNIRPPSNLRSLLGLGLKFIPTPFRTTSFSQINKIDTGIPYLERSLRIRAFFCHMKTSPSVDDEYHHKLHLTSPWNPSEKTFPKVLPP